MNFKCFALTMSLILVLTNPLKAEASYNILEEQDPNDSRIEEMMRFYDEEYFRTTGQQAIIGEGLNMKGTCRKDSCPVWAQINKAEQLMYLYVDGEIKYVWAVSTGLAGTATPDFNQNPNGRVYDYYMSNTFPGGDYNGLGNMAYAVFIRGGYAIHGTPADHWPELGTTASKGCIRLHPDNAFIFNRLVRASGVGSVWITVL